MTARILNVTADEYHALPGLSASIASTLIAKSPLHAWMQHPLFGGHGKKPTKLMDRGTVVHALVLGAGKDFTVLDFGDFRTNAAKDARDAAREAGCTPILAHDFEEAQLIALRIIAGLAERGIVLDGASEQAFAWTEDSPLGPVECRGMMDHVFIDRGRIIDLKIVSNAAPTSVERSAESFGYAIQAAAYTSVLAKLDPSLAGRVEFLFAFCEAEDPYAINLCKPDGMFRELGERRWHRAVNTWGACIATDTWPGYGAGINLITSPPWALTNEEYAA